MKFPNKTLKFNFDHSPKAINSLITQSACVFLDLLQHVKRILTKIYAGNHISPCYQLILNDTEVRINLPVAFWKKRKLLAQVAREYLLAQQADLCYV
jgi:hypothetical protein